VAGRTSDKEASKPERSEPTTTERLPCSGGALHKDGPWNNSRRATPDPVTWQGLIFRIVDDPIRTSCVLALTCPPLTTAALLVNSTVGLTVWAGVGGATILLLARIIVVCRRRAAAAQAGGMPGAAGRDLSEDLPGYPVDLSEHPVGGLAAPKGAAANDHPQAEPDAWVRMTPTVGA
jgi:hypothetical protein